MKTKIMRRSPLSSGIFYGQCEAVLAWVDDFPIAGNTEAIKVKISTGFNPNYLGTPINYIR